MIFFPESKRFGYIPLMISVRTHKPVYGVLNSGNTVARWRMTGTCRNGDPFGSQTRLTELVASSEGNEDLSKATPLVTNIRQADMLLSNPAAPAVGGRRGGGSISRALDGAPAKCIMAEDEVILGNSHERPAKGSKLGEEGFGILTADHQLANGKYSTWTGNVGQRWWELSYAFKPGDHGRQSRASSCTSQDFTQDTKVKANPCKQWRILEYGSNNSWEGSGTLISSRRLWGVGSMCPLWQLARVGDSPWLCSVDHRQGESAGRGLLVLQCVGLCWICMN